MLDQFHHILHLYGNVLSASRIFYSPTTPILNQGWKKHQFSLYILAVAAGLAKFWPKAVIDLADANETSERNMKGQYAALLTSCLRSRQHPLVKMTEYTHKLQRCRESWLIYRNCQRTAQDILFDCSSTGNFKSPVIAFSRRKWEKPCILKSLSLSANPFWWYLSVWFIHQLTRIAKYSKTEDQLEKR